MRDENTVKELIEIATDSATFYAHAVEKVDDPELRRIFTEMGQYKREFVAALRQSLPMDAAGADTDGTVSGAFRRAYADILAMIGDKREAYVNSLEETEDRLLEKLREAIDGIDDPKVSATLQSHLPRIAACHDRMRTLKSRLND